MLPSDILSSAMGAYVSSSYSGCPARSNTPPYYNHPLSLSDSEIQDQTPDASISPRCLTSLFPHTSEVTPHIHQSRCPNCRSITDYLRPTDGIEATARPKHHPCTADRRFISPLTSPPRSTKLNPPACYGSSTCIDQTLGSPQTGLETECLTLQMWPPVADTTLQLQTTQPLLLS